jgi:predicted tellurium resistance membrane protein TerC
MLQDAQIWLSLVTLFVMEMVLGIDNLVFISLLANKLPSAQRKTARLLGLLLALAIRIVLLSAISWIMTLQHSLFNISEWFGITEGIWHKRLDISGRDMVLLVGGLYLIYKANLEIYTTIEKSEKAHASKSSSFWSTVFQIGLFDMILSVDSVITAVGMASHVWVMVVAVVLAMAVMLLASDSLGNFIKKHPSIKLLALAFLLLVGVSLVAEGINEPIPKGYIYFAMTFSIFVVFLILRFVKKRGKFTVK